MKALRRFNRFTDAHPLIAIVMALSALVVFGLIFLPPDPVGLVANVPHAAT
jgi:hypothetical protein